MKTCPALCVELSCYGGFHPAGNFFRVNEMPEGHHNPIVLTADFIKWLGGTYVRPAAQKAD